MTILAFVDTETTALGHLARPWEIAVILRNTEEPTVPDGEWLRQVHYDYTTMPDGTQPAALEIGQFHERAVAFRTGADRFWGLDEEGVNVGSGGEFAIAHWLHELLQGVVLIAAGPHFDAAVLSSMFRRHGLPEQPWHYAILDIKAMAYGHAVARGARPSLPLQSDQLVAETDGPTTSQGERHTAFGDARWVAAWWDHLHTPAPAINVVFDGPPGPEAGRFVEVETDDGRGVSAGEWVERDDGQWALRVTAGSLAGGASRPGHEFKASYSGMVCGAMVMRGGYGDECGLPPENAVHRGAREHADTCWLKTDWPGDPETGLRVCTCAAGLA